MAVSSATFPPRKLRPAASCFISPQLSGLSLLHSIHSLSLQISSLRPLPFILKRNSSSLIHKCKLLSLLFDDILLLPNRRPQSLSFSPSFHLCFEEMFVVLQRIKTLIEDCSIGSKMWLLMQIESISSTFRELTLDLWTLLEILPTKDLKLSEDVEELKNLIIKQCVGDNASVDGVDNEARIEVLNMLDSIKGEIVPDHARLGKVFAQLGLSDSASCREEIECLEDEVQSQSDEKSKSEAIALIGLVRYAKCVLFGASSSFESDDWHREITPDLVIPEDFRCPISLDMMRDPVVVATGQTYDRCSITLWIESGRNTCPKTGQPLARTDLIPNRALKNLIGMWCREQRIPYATAEADGRFNGLTANKTALEATKMTVWFLVDKLSGSLWPTETANRVVHELRVLAKMDSDSRSCIGEAGAIPLLVRYLGSENSNLQVNAVTTILNLSILDTNKTKIMETDGALSGVIEVLRSGATWEAKANAAATIFSLSGVHSYRRKLGKKTRVIRGLLDLAREGPTTSKRDALLAILTLAGDRDCVGRLIEGGVVEIVKEVMDELPEEAVTVLEAVMKRGGLVAVAAAGQMIPKLVEMLRSGASRARESAVATLVIMCRKGGAEMVAELAKISTIEVTIWDLMGTGTARAKRKAVSLMRILQRWAAGSEGDVLEGYSIAMEMP
ncbi:hypothetical protein Ancab_014185 [Ancistrocladus abbreviatus]